MPLLSVQYQRCISIESLLCSAAGHAELANSEACIRCRTWGFLIGLMIRPLLFVSTICVGAEVLASPASETCKARLGAAQEQRDGVSCSLQSFANVCERSEPFPASRAGPGTTLQCEEQQTGVVWLMKTLPCIVMTFYWGQCGFRASGKRENWHTEEQLIHLGTDGSPVPERHDTVELIETLIAHCRQCGPALFVL